MALHIKVADLPLRNHLSYSPIPHLYNRKQERDETSQSTFVPGKPQGIWYGYHDSWLNWQSYEDEDPVEIASCVYLYNLELKDDVLCHIDDKGSQDTRNKVLTLRKSKISDDYKKFYSRYKTTLNAILGLENVRDLGSFTQYIDWKAVADDYAGIDLPEINSHDRLTNIDGKISFTYTWDVNSGCIWDVDAVVKSFTLVGPDRDGSDPKI